MATYKNDTNPTLVITLPVQERGNQKIYYITSTKIWL